MNQNNYLPYDQKTATLIDGYFRGFTWWFPDRFIDSLEGYSQRQGSMLNEYEQCYFPEDFEENEPGNFGKEGVGFFFYYPAAAEDCVVVVSHEIFYRHLAKACEKYISEHPYKEQIVTELLQKIKTNLEV